MTDTSVTDVSASSSLFTPSLVMDKWAKYTQELSKEELAKMMPQERESTITMQNVREGWERNGNHEYNITV